MKIISKVTPPPPHRTKNSFVTFKKRMVGFIKKKILVGGSFATANVVFF